MNGLDQAIKMRNVVPKGSNFIPVPKKIATNGSLSELKDKQVPFENPDDLLTKFVTLEKENLHLIEKTQESEMVLMKMKEDFRKKKEDKMDRLGKLISRKDFLVNEIESKDK